MWLQATEVSFLRLSQGQITTQVRHCTGPELDHGKPLSASALDTYSPPGRRTVIRPDQSRRHRAGRGLPRHLEVLVPTLPFGRPDEVLPAVHRAAQRHGLPGWDPQMEEPPSIEHLAPEDEDPS
ncbi:hypothetical protein Kisp02_33040 [Kineosporia sp. NBRC 101731]|nr:hypothetical protein Kisp02_33040 [Kineosporia sp. NBRC 101731]